MSELFGGLMKPGQGSRVALRRELETRRDQWDREGYLYRGGGDFLLRHGTFFQGRALPDEYADAFGESNGCFWNAVAACRDCPELRYFEGVYASHGGYTPHGWCVAPDGGVVEVTWPTREGQTPLPAVDSIMGMPLLPPDHMAYCGVEFSPDLIEWFAETYGQYCLLDRPSVDRDRNMQTGRLDLSQSHDNPILKVPYDPKRTSL